MIIIFIGYWKDLISPSIQYSYRKLFPISADTISAIPNINMIELILFILTLYEPNIEEVIYDTTNNELNEIYFMLNDLL